MTGNLEFSGTAHFPDVLCDLYNTEKCEIKPIQKIYR